jgi:plastocyanin
LLLVCNPKRTFSGCVPGRAVPTGKFRSKALDTDQSFEFTFATAGDYDYYCGLHPHMKGKIVVAPQ